MLGRSQIARFLTMPNQKPDAEAALRKLGQRIREGHAIKHPISDRSLKTVRDTVKEQFEHEQKGQRDVKPSKGASKEQQREPEDDR